MNETGLRGLAKLYYDSVKAGERGILQVPTMFRDKVKEALERVDGWVFED